MQIDVKSGGLGAFLSALLVAGGAWGLQFLGEESQSALVAKGIAHYCALDMSARETFRARLQAALQAQGVTYQPQLCVRDESSESP